MAFLLSVLFMIGGDPSVLTVHTVLEVKIWTQEEVKELAILEAKKYGLHQKRFLAVLKCENNFNAIGQSEHINNKGERERSFGAVQIHLPSHPGITQEQAEDPLFAIPWMAEQWGMGNASKWTCYNNLYGVGES